MSHPSINRWGNNLFWYNLWFTDKNKNLLIHQDSLFLELIYLYISYGLSFKKNFFINNYWINFKKFNINLLLLKKEYNFKYFQLMEYKSRLTGLNSHYKIRKNLKHFYPSKLWILRFNNWIVLTLYSYQPSIKKYLKKKSLNKTTNFYLKNEKKLKTKLILILRYKLFFDLYMNLNINFKNYYNF